MSLPTSKAAGLRSKRRKRTRAREVSRVQIVISSSQLVARLGTRVSRVQLNTGELRAIREGRLEEPRLLTAAVRQAISELGAGRAVPVAVALPSMLFQIHVGSLPIPAGVDPQAAVQNNLERIYAVRDDEYGDFSVVPERNGESRVVYITAHRSHIAPYTEAITAAGTKVISVEPTLTAELRTIASLRMDESVSVMSLEEGTAFASELLEGELLSSVALPALENALLAIDTDLEKAVAQVGRLENSLLDNAQGQQASQETLNVLRQNADYSQSLWQRTDIPTALIVTGLLQGEGGTEMIREELMLPAERIDPSQYIDSLASEGLGLRMRAEVASLDFNLLVKNPKTANKRSSLHPAVLPAAILLLAAGSYAYAATRESQTRNEISKLQQAKDTLAPRVSEQLELQERNRAIQADLDRAEEIRSQRGNLASYVELLIDRLPDEQIGVASLVLSDAQVERRAFDGRPVDRVFEITVQGASQGALMEVIRAYEQNPFRISVDSITPAPGENDVRVLRASIGAVSTELDQMIDPRRPDSANGTEPTQAEPTQAEPANQ